MHKQLETAPDSNELMLLLLNQQREILDRLDLMAVAQSLSLVKEAYTTEEAAERLGRSEWTVRQWCNKKQVNGAYKVRGKGRTGEWRLPHEAIVALQNKGPIPIGTHLLAA
jgi:predicted transcriptional regulator